MTGAEGDRPHEVPHHTYYGPTAHQVGDGNTQYNNHYVTAGAPLDLAADELARAVRVQWQEEAGLRRLLDPAPLPVRWRLSEREVTGPVGAATAEGSRARFAPLPGLVQVTGDRLREDGGLRELHEVYGGLASGRMLLIGPPAAGKTAAAVLLLLEALAHREAAGPQDRARIPVPVLLNLEGWPPARQSIADWAAERLSLTYAQLRGRRGQDRARELVTTGRIALFLDALDEADVWTRPEIVSALEAAPCRLMLLSRAEEAAETAAEARLGGAVALEIQPVRPADAAGYLLRPLPDPPPPAWRALTGHLLDPGSADSPVTRALSSPLSIALLRDAHPDDGPVDRLMDTARFPEPDAIEDHLLDVAIAAAYTPRPGYPRPRYTAETAERTLRLIASALTLQRTRDLRWWHIPSWTSARPRAVCAGLLVGGLCLTVGILLVPHEGPVRGWTETALLTLTSGVAAAWRVWDLGAPQPLPSVGWRDLFPPGTLLRGVVSWLLMTVALWLLMPLGGSDPPLPECALGALPAGFVLALAFGEGRTLLVGNVIGFTVAPEAAPEAFQRNRRPAEYWPRSRGGSVGPREVWRHHIGLRLALGPLIGLSVALFTSFLGGWHQNPRFVVLSGAVMAIWPTLMAGPFGNLAVATGIAAVQLSLRHGTPVRLLTFLEDARRRNLLRATGPVYQFRHARLQERLAVSSGPGSGRRRTPPAPPPY